MRPASGVAPVRRTLDAGVPFGFEVDGSASNDASHMVGEARHALLLARVRRSLDPLGCDLCASPQAAWTVANGRTVVRESRLATIDLGP